MKQKPNIVQVLNPQHSCFCYEDDAVCVTVWSKKKKRMRRYEINTHLDLAKADLMAIIMGKK